MMLIPFNDLPAELRAHIFELAIASEYHTTARRRVVEIFVKHGEIYSKTAPPPLLCVSRESRYITLKYYKPWLPIFKGTPIHEPWAQMVEENGVESLSRLQNVCIRLDHDILLLKDRKWSPSDFGPLEFECLRNLAFDLTVGGGRGRSWKMTTIQLLLGFKHLDMLHLFDPKNPSGINGRVIRTLMELRLKDKRYSDRAWKVLSDYYSPHPQTTPVTADNDWDPTTWIRYKHTRHLLEEGFTIRKDSRCPGYGVRVPGQGTPLFRNYYDVLDLDHDMEMAASDREEDA
jgi:hypothetical protein